VSYIAPAAETSNGVVTYAVRVSFPDEAASVKVGMTANLSILTAQKDGVLLAPNSALLPKGAGRVVQVPDANGATREVDVQTGLTDGTNTEITSGLSEGQQVIASPLVERPRTGGPFGN
jgi:HlyD family secretion protein